LIVGAACKIIRPEGGFGVDYGLAAGELKVLGELCCKIEVFGTSPRSALCQKSVVLATNGMGSM
jgi:hypothetical protein